MMSGDGGQVLDVNVGGTIDFQVRECEGEGTKEGRNAESSGGKPRVSNCELS